MSRELLTELVPLLTRPWEKKRFDVFEVMHHGTHEKQRSNIFAWLLDDGATHELKDAFSRILVEEINSKRDEALIEPKQFVVLQEQNTSETDETKDIADIVLIDAQTAIVIENFKDSDGHGHSYERYLNYGKRDGRESVVVMLCESEISGSLKHGWQAAEVVTYATFMAKVCDHVEGIKSYRDEHPEQYAFFKQLRKHFVKGKEVNDEASIEFVSRMCAADETETFRRTNHEIVDEEFGNRLRDEAILRLRESREMLARVKQGLKRYCEGALRDHTARIDRTEIFDQVAVNLSGIYKWALVLEKDGRGEEGGIVHILFGPTAAFANGQNRWYSEVQVPVPNPNYSYVFLVDGSRRRIKQTNVNLGDVLNGLHDDSLANEIIEFLGE